MTQKDFKRMVSYYRNNSKLQLVKFIYDVTDLGLKESKELVDTHYYPDNMLNSFSPKTKKHLRKIKIKIEEKLDYIILK